MKRIAGSLCVIALAVVAGNADAGRMYAGAKGGVNMADLAGDDAGGLDMRNGFSGGVFYGSDFGGQLGVRGEVLYVMKGAEGDFVIPGDDHGHESIIRLNYLDVPVLFVANFPAGDKFSFNILAGPSFNFNLDAEVEVPSHNETTDIKDSVKSVEFGAIAGGGLEYMLSSLSIVLDVRYSLGAATIAEDVAGESADIKNRGLGVMAGVMFPFGSR